jgi:hypothetical protein
VIWRKPREVGVKFETWLDERIRASRTIKPEAGKKTDETANEAAKSV